MLTQETKRKIDSARNILVGKVPDPKAQVEQITTALIYKFMDDMDKEAIELGGKARFFTKGFEKYAWTKLLDQKLGGHERLELYGEAVAKMSQNPHIPQLFRDIFKDAFLPYRSPETLTLFLKEINGFTYDHSEDLGNAFEYLLSILGSQGDAGQFRTPRHIIDFIAEVVDPKKGDTILDPACGTAGFLISAYKHILKQQKDKPLTPDEKKKLMNNLVGYDISPDMVKLSKVNMYLHGFAEPKIFEYDTLSSEEKWDEMYDVIMANPPFMSPSGGIRPHKRFSVQANRSEVLFVDYIKEHLRPNGRAGIIVPESIIFQSAGAYKQLRKILVEDGLFAVVSLPVGVFNPYSGVKTSILFFDNSLAKKTDKILFVRVLNDGFDLGAQRRPVDRNDLVCPDNEVDATKVLKGQRIAIETGTKNPWLQENSLFAYEITKEQIARTGDYSLSAEKYRLGNLGEKKNIKYPMVELGEILDYEQPTKYIVSSVDYDDKYETPVLTAGKTFILGYTNEKNGIFQEKLPVIIFDDFTTAKKFVDFPFKVKSSAMKILYADKNKANIKFLFHTMQKIVFPVNEHKRYWISEYSKIKIPLPPIEVQNEIAEQIEVKQQAIEHAKAIIESIERERQYFTQSLRTIKNIEYVKLGEVVDILDNMRKPITKSDRKAGKYPYYGATGILDHVEGYIFDEKLVLVGEDGAKWDIGDQTAFIADGKYWVNNHAHVLRPQREKIVDEFLVGVLNAIDLSPFITGVTVPKLNQEKLRSIDIPLPPLEIQKKMIEGMEKEKEIIEANKKLIGIMEQKIADVLSEI